MKSLLSLGKYWAIEPDTFNNLEALVSKDAPVLENTRTVRIQNGVAIIPVSGAVSYTHLEISQRTLNPQFTEWLMGWPTGWTELEPAATAWCLWWRRMRLQFLRLTLNLQQQVS